MHFPLPAILAFGASHATVGSFLIFALTSSASPGPNNLLIMSVAARSGLKRTLPCILTITLAFGAMLLLGAMGGGAILHHFPAMTRILGTLGCVWILYLAWTIARPRPDAAIAGALPHLSKAFLLCWSNPKAWMMAMTTGTTYLPQGPQWNAWLFAMIGAKLAIGLISQFGWAVLGVTLYRSGVTARRLALVNAVMGVLLALSALVLLV